MWGSTFIFFNNLHIKCSHLQIKVRFLCCQYCKFNMDSQQKFSYYQGCVLHRIPPCPPGDASQERGLPSTHSAARSQVPPARLTLVLLSIMSSLFLSCRGRSRQIIFLKYTYKELFLIHATAQRRRWEISGSFNPTHHCARYCQKWCSFAFCPSLHSATQLTPQRDQANFSCGVVDEQIQWPTRVRSSWFFWPPPPSALPAQWEQAPCMSIKMAQNYSMQGNAGVFGHFCELKRFIEMSKSSTARGSKGVGGEAMGSR